MGGQWAGPTRVGIKGSLFILFNKYQILTRNDDSIIMCNPLKACKNDNITDQSNLVNFVVAIEHWCL